ncbi:metallophosphoesterase family protein [Halogeometricum borinquense]|uniref:Phosphoesterase n=1 Tax=Halogeometricum borinquense TaxID=60847 RepID=A0A6C0UFW5_9EURY|nr:metallophosphoesterase family protein [Halogeometricum borinquense]QIB73171.1 metallophosphoesterase family protein [Halogeometricum borinquense]QIQ77433.1 metallophosphoesterase family protein [Halogeometricum borinquense]
MRVGICSDTHDNLELARGAVETFESAGVETVIHCGDIVSPFTANVFDADFDFHAVRGNNDGEWNLSNVVDSFGTYHGECATFDFDGTAVAAYHGTSETLVDGLVESGDYDYVFRGHTHQRTYEKSGETVHINPGGLPIPGADDTYHVALLDVDEGDVAFYEV